MVAKKKFHSARLHVRQFLSKYRYSLASIVLILGVWGMASAVAWNYFEQEQELQEATSQQQLHELDQAIERLEAEKQAQEKLEEEKRKAAAEAEAKKKAEEEARRAAEASQNTQAGGTSGSCNTASSHTNPNAIDVMVNKKHCLKPLSFAPPDLVSTHGATISAKAAADFNRMYADAVAAGQAFTVSSSYRSYATQVSTYNYWVSVNGKAAADTVSARPGFSEHQTGLAVDVGVGGCTLGCFGGTSQYQWFQANAAKYGFIQRYYSGYEHITGYAGETWHYRYIGVAAAQDMQAKGIKTLEQYWGMEGGTYR